MNRYSKTTSMTNCRNCYLMTGCSMTNRCLMRTKGCRTTMTTIRYSTS
ncbi:hypothetical protein Poly59_54160 [Rubripirellula reticaptiva]|uniref:Uncharacterized protein n=1 Tax=Rubripirellula reticaptiva TaxID=2528013 RepID=A0A5C6E9T9_9BACT|nr:hypothetical protein Poly59_54160 [Rubripirellula reticaptiva]